MKNGEKKFVIIRIPDSMKGNLDRLIKEAKLFYANNKRYPTMHELSMVADMEESEARDIIREVVRITNEEIFIKDENAE